MSSNDAAISENKVCKSENVCEKGKSSITSLCQVRVADLMSSDVQVVQGSWSVSMLAKFFISKKISGAPVVDEDQHLVGVVSATDIMEFENISHKEKVEITRNSYFEDVIGQNLTEDDIERLSLHAEDSCTTESIMTPHIISVAPDSSVPAVAQLMASKHIHRVFVTDNKNIVGVVSTTDVLACVGSLCAD